MRKTLAAIIAAGIVSTIAASAFAQAPAPKGPADCKADEVWDAATKTCKPRS